MRKDNQTIIRGKKNNHQPQRFDHESSSRESLSIFEYMREYIEDSTSTAVSEDTLWKLYANYESSSPKDNYLTCQSAIRKGEFDTAWRVAQQAVNDYLWRIKRAKEEAEKKKVIYTTKVFGGSRR